MNLPQVTDDLMPDDLVDVTLVCAGDVAALAALQLARHFGLPCAEAETILAVGRGLVASHVPLKRAKAAVSLMATLGVRLAIVEFGEGPGLEVFDLSMRLTDPGVASSVLQKLRALGFASGDVASKFHGPGGYELCNLTRDRADGLLREMRAFPGVELVCSPQTEARYDVFAGPRGNRRSMALILRHLADIGCHACDPWPALAVGLDRRMLAHLDARFPDHGLICVNHKFQRYDLTLTGLGSVSVQDFADFLTTRGHAPYIALEVVTGRRGLRLESGLTRATALQFLSDYALIGLQVRADFVHSTEKTVKMSPVKSGFMPIL